MSHKDHEAQMRALGAIELEAAADRLERIRVVYEQNGTSDVGVALTPWIQKLHQGAADERQKVEALAKETSSVGRRSEIL